jgi:hypothetical protein
MRPEAKAAELAAKLGLTSAAVAEFFKVFREQDVPEEKPLGRLIEIATYFRWNALSSALEGGGLRLRSDRAT